MESEATNVLHEWDGQRLLNTRAGISYYDGLTLHNLGHIGEGLAAEILRLATALSAAEDRARRALVLGMKRARRLWNLNGDDEDFERALNQEIAAAEREEQEDET